MPSDPSAPRGREASGNGEASKRGGASGKGEASGKGAAAGIVTGLFAEGAAGVRLHCALAGAAALEDERPLMLLLHGFPEFWFGWASVMPALATRFKVIAPDLRGYNLSDKPGTLRGYGIRALTGDVCALIDRFGGGRCVLVGHDWGGALAWNVAIAHPQRVSKLAILNGPHPWLFWHALATDARQQAASAYMNWLRRDGSEALLAENAFARLEGFFARFGTADWFDQAARAAYHAAWSQPGALAGGVNYYRASPLYPPADGDRGAAGISLQCADFVVRVPTQVIWGVRDTALLPLLLDGLDGFVADLRVEQLPQASHWLVHEEPERVAECLLDFCDDGA